MLTQSYAAIRCHYATIYKMFGHFEKYRMAIEGGFESILYLYIGSYVQNNRHITHSRTRARTHTHTQRKYGNLNDAMISKCGCITFIPLLSFFDMATSGTKSHHTQGVPKLLSGKFVGLKSPHAFSSLALDQIHKLFMTVTS